MEYTLLTPQGETIHMASLNKKQEIAEGDTVLAVVQWSSLDKIV